MPLPSPLADINLLRIVGTDRTRARDRVIEELPVALVYNGQSHAVMMATPSDLPDFALGFSLSEGIVERPVELDLISVAARAEGVVIEMAIDAEAFAALEQRRRNLVGTSACGLCGSESLAQAMRPAPVVRDGGRSSAAIIADALARIPPMQALNGECGGAHAAAFADANGWIVREDVGRHNALDKVIGARAAAGLGDGLLVLSSRASYELVHKAAVAQLGLVVAMSAPTAMAIRLANACNITLIGFARGERMNVYTHAWRV